MQAGETRPGTTTVVLQRAGATVVINDVPARVCENCVEEYVDENVAENVLAAAQASVLAHSTSARIAALRATETG